MLDFSFRHRSRQSRRRISAAALAAAFAGAVFVSVFITPGIAAARTSDQPQALVVTDEPLPPELQSKIYYKPRVAPRTHPAQVLGPQYYSDGTETAVGAKINDLRSELFGLQGKVADLSENLASLEVSSQHVAAEYYASVATISTQLQSGTTPGNPRLVNRLNVARGNLERLSQNISDLNNLAVQISEAASMSSYLLDSARATYSLSGAIEEDHVRLAQLEDAVNNTVVIIERLLNNVNDDITRTTSYLAAERDNLRTLSLAINTGDMFGKSLSNRPFSSVQKASFTPVAASAYSGELAPPPVPPTATKNGFHDLTVPPPMDDGFGAPELPPPGIEQSSFAPPAADEPASAPLSPRPLVKIRFDRPNVAYEQPVYMVVNEALNRYPDARFELVAVHPSTGNAAELAIESTRSRRNAERVLRSLTEMGLPMDRIELSHTPSADATTNEVHLYVR